MSNFYLYLRRGNLRKILPFEQGGYTPLGFASDECYNFIAQAPSEPFIGIVFPDWKDCRDNLDGWPKQPGVGIRGLYVWGGMFFDEVDLRGDVVLSFDAYHNDEISAVVTADYEYVRAARLAYKQRRSANSSPPAPAG